MIVKYYSDVFDILSVKKVLPWLAGNDEIASKANACVFITLHQCSIIFLLSCFFNLVYYGCYKIDKFVFIIIYGIAYIINCYYFFLKNNNKNRDIKYSKYIFISFLISSIFFALLIYLISIARLYC